MKTIFFDIDSTTLLSKDGRVRPFMDVVLEYCFLSRIKVYVATSNQEQVQKLREAYPDAWGNSITGEFQKGGAFPSHPDLVISCDSQYLDKFPGLLVPPYNPERSNKFSEISLAGRLLDTIKDRVVLSRNAPEKVAVEKPKEKPSEDPTNHAFEL